MSLCGWVVWQRSEKSFMFSVTNGSPCRTHDAATQVSF